MRLGTGTLQVGLAGKVSVKEEGSIHGNRLSDHYKKGTVKLKQLHVVAGL